MSFEKFSYESPKIIVEFDLSVSAGSKVESIGFPFSSDPLEIESLGLGDPFDLAH